MESKEFIQRAREKFGDKFILGSEVNINSDVIEELNKKFDSHVTVEDLRKLDDELFLKDTKCPNCGEELFGLFGAFNWTIVHGVCACANCNKTIFRYYHYVGDCKNPIKSLSLIGFS